MTPLFLRLVPACVRTLPVALVLGLSAPGFAAPAEPNLESADEHDVGNFHQVNAQLYRSAHPEAGAFPYFASLGIKTVLSLEDYGGDQNAVDAEQGLAEANGMQFIWIPMSPILKPSVEQIGRALAVIETAADQPVLVHCQLGADRTGLVIAAYRLKHDKWTLDAAIKELYEDGHSPLLGWWDDVLQQLP